MSKLKTILTILPILGIFVGTQLAVALAMSLVLTLVWNYAIVGTLTFATEVVIFQPLVLVVMLWLIGVAIAWAKAYNNLLIYQWQTKKVQESARNELPNVFKRFGF